MGLRARNLGSEKAGETGAGGQIPPPKSGKIQEVKDCRPELELKVSG